MRARQQSNFIYLICGCHCFPVNVEAHLATWLGGQANPRSTDRRGVKILKEKIDKTTLYKTMSALKLLVSPAFYVGQCKSGYKAWSKWITEEHKKGSAKPLFYYCVFMSLVMYSAKWSIVGSKFSLFMYWPIRQATCWMMQWVLPLYVDGDFRS